MANLPGSLPSSSPTNHGAVLDEIIAAATMVGTNPAGPVEANLRDRVAALDTGRAATGGIPVIFDTDMSVDVDDAMALRYLLNKDTQGYIDLIGTVVCSSTPDGCAAVDAGATRDGRLDMRLGQYQGTAIAASANAFVTNMAAMTGREVPRTVTGNMTAIRAYRRMLVGSAGSVRIIAVGFLTALNEFLNSPSDDIYAGTGSALLTAKCEAVFCMGGQYPSGTEYNFSTTSVAAAAANNFVANCPVPIYFLGREIGAGVVAGQRALENIHVANGLTSPANSGDWMVNALIDYVDGQATFADNGRKAWDPMTCHLAIAGTTSANSPVAAGYTTVQGTNSVNATSGANTFTAGAGNHYYVVRAQDDVFYAEELNDNFYPEFRRRMPRKARYKPELDVNWTPDQAKVPPSGWWKAAGLTAGALTNWTSTTTTGSKVFTQATAANKPTVVDLGSGDMVVRFDGADWMDASDALLRTPDVSVWVVATSTAATNAAYTSLIGVPPSLSTHVSPWWYWGMGRWNNAGWARFALNVWGPSSAEASTGWGNNKIYELSTRDGNYRLNGRATNDAMARQTITYTNSTAVRIGANGAGGEGWLGDVREVVIFPSSQRPADQRAMLAYFRRTYTIG